MRVLIVGAGQAGSDLATHFLRSSAQRHRVMAFIDDAPTKWGGRVHGIPIVGPIDTIPHLAAQLRIDLIALALPSAPPTRISEILAVCQQTSAGIKIMPGLDEMVERPRHAHHLRDVNVPDLLGREVVPLQTPATRDFLRGKTVLVTGAAGSIGSELCRQLLSQGPARIIALDTNETGLFDLAESLRADPASSCLCVRIGDITDVHSIEHLFSSERPHVVFHAAAYKHVPLLEQHPRQAIRTNVLGTYYLCRLARRSSVGTFVFISSDKAAEPVNILGASKRTGELIVQAMASSGDDTTQFCAVRFGNVIGSRGSVVPLFTQQIEHGGPVTVTDAAATRYFMTIPEACGLVILTSTIAGNGNLFLLDMGNPVRIADLAVKMIRLRGLRVGHDIHIRYTGLRPGERLHEVLAGPDERLLPTTHHKILRIEPEGEMPTLATIAQRLQRMQASIADGNTAGLREGLFDLVRESGKRVSSTAAQA